MVQPKIYICGQRWFTNIHVFVCVKIKDTRVSFKNDRDEEGYNRKISSLAQVQSVKIPKKNYFPFLFYALVFSIIFCKVFLS